MKTTQLIRLFDDAIAGGHGTRPVVIPNGAGLSFTFEATTDTPMVRAHARSNAYVLGRKNARRFVCVEANLANYPSAASARRDCLTVARLAKVLRVADPQHPVLARAGMAQEAAAFREVHHAKIAAINGAGLPKFVSRGGAPAFILYCD